MDKKEAIKLMLLIFDFKLKIKIYETVNNSIFFFTESIDKIEHYFEFRLTGTKVFIFSEISQKEILLGSFKKKYRLRFFVKEPNFYETLFNELIK